VTSSYNYGMQAEEAVISHYKKLGYALIKHRYKTPHGEIDIIVKSAEFVVFIEVKARTNPKHSEFLTERQIKRCCNAALHFIGNMEEKYGEVNFRFDLAIVIDEKIAEIIESAWVCDY
jgi:putative endonuclease